MELENWWVVSSMLPFWMIIKIILFMNIASSAPLVKGSVLLLVLSRKLCNKKVFSLLYRTWITEFGIS